MALRSSSSNAGNNVTVPSVPVPTGVATDDIVILLYSADGAPSGTPSGFTQLDTSSTSFGPDGETIRIYWKRATGADTGSYTWISTGVTWTTQAFAFSGRDTGNPPVNGTLNQSGTIAAATTLSVSANTVSALAGDDLLWAVGVDINGALTISSISTVPTGYTSIAVKTDPGGFGGTAAANHDNVSAGATGTVTGTLTFSGSSSHASAAWVIRIPSAGGATPQNVAPTSAAISEADNAVTAPALLAATGAGIARGDLLATAASLLSASASAITTATATVTAGVISISPTASAVAAATSAATAAARTAPTSGAVTLATVGLTAAATAAPTAASVTSAVAAVKATPQLAPAAASVAAGALAVTVSGARQLTPLAGAVTAATATVSTPAVPVPVSPVALVASAATGIVVIAPISTTPVPASGETPISTTAVPASTEAPISTTPVPAAGSLQTTTVPVSSEAPISTVPVAASGETVITTGAIP